MQTPIPQKALTLNRKVDECKPLAGGCGRQRSVRQVHGRAVQVDPIKPTLKAPGSKQNMMNWSQPLLSNSTCAPTSWRRPCCRRRSRPSMRRSRQGLTFVRFSAQPETLLYLTPPNVSLTHSIDGGCNISVDKEVLTLSLKVDECKPLDQGGGRRGRGRRGRPHGALEGIGRFRYIAWVKCPYRVAVKASAIRAGNRSPG